MNVLLMLAHSIEEFDQLRLLAALPGLTVASIGAYLTPDAPQDDKRPGLDIPPVELVKAAVDRLGQPGHGRHGDCDGGTPHENTLDAAKRGLPDDVIDWADVIVCHHLEREWLGGQWSRIRHKRVVWRTVGQSGEGNEAAMRPLREDGLEVVRYSPNEAAIPGYIGRDALIRFYKDPDEWAGWSGHVPVVTNVTQNMIDRDPWCNPHFWLEATRGIPTRPMGAGSERIGGIGSLPLERMQNGLRNARAYLYTGTQPASYTLGLIEAGMIGVPIVSIGPGWMRVLEYGPALFEAPELVPLGGYEDPLDAGAKLRELLNDRAYAAEVALIQRRQFVATFGRDRVAADWADFLATGSVPDRDLVEAEAVA